MVRKFLILGSTLSALAATPAAAAPVKGIHAPRETPRPTIHLANGDNPTSGLANMWRFQRDWNEPQGSYETALKFAECVSRLDPAAPRAMLEGPIGGENRADLVRLAQRNRGCVVHSGAVAPVLLRAALAETLVRRGLELRDWTDADRPAGVGVPAAVDGYPIAAIARCQVHRAPGLVADVLRTNPGSSAEREAVQRLFGGAAECGADRPGRMTPTAARLALIDAAFVRSR